MLLAKPMGIESYNSGLKGTANYALIQFLIPLKREMSLVYNVAGKKSNSSALWYWFCGSFYFGKESTEHLSRGGYGLSVQHMELKPDYI